MSWPLTNCLGFFSSKLCAIDAAPLEKHKLCPGIVYFVIWHTYAHDNLPYMYWLSCIAVSVIYISVCRKTGANCALSVAQQNVSDERDVAVDCSLPAVHPTNTVSVLL